MSDSKHNDKPEAPAEPPKAKATLEQRVIDLERDMAEMKAALSKKR